jgi:2-polyprenyl-3-methyl-5-hydroxy-6-metoxy-1,4-benzoquinol methylase
MQENAIKQVTEFYNGYLPKLVTENARHRWVFASLDAAINPGSKVLDIGCGAGHTSLHLAKMGCTVVAVDLSPILIKHAREHNNHENILYVAGDACQLDLSDKFDAIVLVDVLEHILPQAVEGLFKLLEQVSHACTKIYLNIPSPDILRFLRTNKPDNLQIVDEPIETGDIIGRFKAIGFTPAFFRFYWCQYVEYLFLTDALFNKVLTKTYGLNKEH